MKKLLITGASGFLGWHLCQVAQSSWQVHGTYHSHAVNLPNIILHSLDLTDFFALNALLETVQPDAIIHAAAQSSPNICQGNPIMSFDINVIASENLAGLCADAEIPCVFTSTDLVFDGTKAPYRETDAVCPISTYGEQKVTAELRMSERYPEITICRLPLMFGAAPYAQSFIQPFLDTLKSGQLLPLFTDEFRTPVSGIAAARGILLALEKCQGAVVHLGGRERLSRYDFGCLLVDSLGCFADQLRPCEQADIPMSAPRPADVSLDSRLAFDLGYEPGSVQKQLQQLAPALGVTKI